MVGFLVGIIASLLGTAFAYLLIYKLRSRGTIGLHRRQDDVRRKRHEATQTIPPQHFYLMNKDKDIVRE